MVDGLTAKPGIGIGYNHSNTSAPFLLYPLGHDHFHVVSLWLAVLTRLPSQSVNVIEMLLMTGSVYDVWPRAERGPQSALTIYDFHCQNCECRVMSAFPSERRKLLQQRHSLTHSLNSFEAMRRSRLWD